MEPKKELSIIVLAYNEEQSLELTVRRCVEVADELGIDYEVVIVEDGSTDRTKQIARELSKQFKRVRGVFHPKNQGSGMAIRSGVAASEGERMIYVPADGQFDVSELGRFLKAAELADIVIGARLSRSDYTWFRMLSSRTFLQLIRILFGTTFRDVNWVHLWHRRVEHKKFDPANSGPALVTGPAGPDVSGKSSVVRAVSGGPATQQR
jgi:glycosyltransferase involved in cell wall biosynthesis